MAATTNTDHRRSPFIIGTIGLVMLLVVIAAPLLYAQTTPLAILRTYASAGIGGLWVVAGIGLALAVVFAAAITDRTDPATAAGIGLGAGLIVLLVAALWAVSVETATIAAITADTWFRHHRWIVVLLAMVPALTSLWAALSHDLL